MLLEVDLQRPRVEAGRDESVTCVMRLLEWAYFQTLASLIKDIWGVKGVRSGDRQDPARGCVSRTSKEEDVVQVEFA